MGHNASPERVRRDILGSKLRELAGFRLAFDCGNARCSGERTINIGVVAKRQNPDELVCTLIDRLRCAGCGRQPRVVHLESGPRMAAQRGGWRRIMLEGLFPIGDER